MFEDGRERIRAWPRRLYSGFWSVSRFRAPVPGYRTGQSYTLLIICLVFVASPNKKTRKFLTTRSWMSTSIAGLLSSTMGRATFITVPETRRSIAVLGQCCGRVQARFNLGFFLYRNIMDELSRAALL